MRNIRKSGDKLAYECDGVDCNAPDVPHHVHRDYVLASLYTILDEMAEWEDPRTEAIDAAVTYMFQELYPEVPSESGVPENPPFTPAYKQLHKILADFYASMPPTTEDMEIDPRTLN